MMTRNILFSIVVCLTTVTTVSLASGIANHTTTSQVVVSNCADVNHCDRATCNTSFVADAGACVPLPANNNIMNASFATFTCLSNVFACSPTRVFFNDSTCSGTPAETLWTPCGTCLQFPARLQACEVHNDEFLVRVKSCSDNTCGICEDFGNRGLPPRECYPHPGVPGLFLEYNNLESCSAVQVEGFSDSKCTELVALATLPGQNKCFGGLTLSCV